MIFDNKSAVRYYQAKCVVIGRTFPQVKNSYSFDKSLLYAVAPDMSLVIESDVIKASKICVLTGLVESRKEFQRKLNEKAIFYNDSPLITDIDISITEPSIFHEFRLGKRFLEVVIPLQETNKWFILQALITYLKQKVKMLNIRISCGSSFKR